MKKVRGYHLLLGASALMLPGFLIHLAVDYYGYIRSSGSAPFWVWVLADAVIWLVPALLALAAGIVARKKMRKKEKSL